MAGITSNSVMEFNLFLRIDEAEARALKDLTKYGHKAFLEMFYNKLGKSDLEKNEAGLISLFEKIDKELPKHLKRIDSTRDVFQKNNPNIPNS